MSEIFGFNASFDSQQLEFVAELFSFLARVWRSMPITDDIHGNIFPTSLAQPVLSIDRSGKP